MTPNFLQEQWKAFETAIIKLSFVSVQHDTFNAVFNRQKMQRMSQAWNEMYRSFCGGWFKDGNELKETLFFILLMNLTNLYFDMDSAGFYEKLKAMMFEDDLDKKIYWALSKNNIHQAFTTGSPPNYFPLPPLRY